MNCQVLTRLLGLSLPLIFPTLMSLRTQSLCFQLPSLDLFDTQDEDCFECVCRMCIRRHWYDPLKCLRHMSACVRVCTNEPQGGGLFGMDIASMSGVLGTNGYKNYFGHPKSYTQGYITAAMPFGSIFGTLSSSFFSDRFSRKVAIQVCCLLWIIGSS